MAKKAIKKFKTAFSELLGKSPYDELTIVQVADAAKVTRQSFYYHYESMDDFVFDIISDGLDDAINKDRRKNISLETSQNRHRLRIPCNRGYRLIFLPITLHLSFHQSLSKSKRPPKLSKSAG